MVFRSIFLAGLLAGVAIVSCAAPAFAAARQAPDPRLDVLEQQLRDMQRQLADIKAGRNGGAALADLTRGTASQLSDLTKRVAAQPRTSLNNGRFTITSADGAFSLSLRSLIQFDAGHFAQGRNPPNVDLNSGTNFRRAQIGFTGTAWRDWSYNVAYDFGGNGIESSGYLYRAYLQYDGLKPFGFRIGAFAPSAGIEDATSGGDLIFLERATSASLARGIAAARSRQGASIFAQGETYLLSLALTGARVGDPVSFDEQQGLVSRAAWLAVSTDDVKWLLDANASHLFKVADVAAGAFSPNTFRLSSGPELAVDASRTVDTGAMDARKVTEYGFETGASWNRLYGQAGWFHYDITRRTALPGPDFSGWYALATWSLTGETRRYDPAVASFRGLRPDHPLGSQGFGAWEVKARYSNIDLDYLPFAAAAMGGVAGGVQNVWSLGLNWYPNETIRFMLDYDNIQVNHANAPATDISANAIGLRSQIAL